MAIVVLDWTLFRRAGGPAQADGDHADDRATAAVVFKLLSSHASGGAGEVRRGSSRDEGTAGEAANESDRGGRGGVDASRARPRRRCGGVACEIRRWP